ncbi:MAG: thiamine pyrophosphate-binding protein [Rubrivivax sp.]
MLKTLQHGGDRVAAALQAQGVTHVFTLCGGHISPILSASKARGIRIVDVRDEVTAVFAADASARLTGRPGVAAVTAGPGITNTITALKNAQLAQSPVVLIGGAAPTALQGRGALQDIDQRPLVEPHVKRFLKIQRVRDLGPAVAEAFALAQSGVPGPVFIECPVDLLYDEASIRQWYADAAGKGTSLPDRALRWYLNRHAQRMFAGSDQPASLEPQAVQVPHAAEGNVQEALAALRKSQRPLMVIGSQAVVQAGEAHALAAAVRRLGIPVYLSGMARGLLGRDDALQMRHQRRNALREADCVLLAGVPCDFRLDYGKHVRRSATLIAANRSAKDARLNRRPDVLALGDAGQFIRRLAGALGSPVSGWAGWCETLRGRDAEREVEIDAQATVHGKHVNPLAFFRALEAEAGEHAVFVAEPAATSSPRQLRAAPAVARAGWTRRSARWSKSARAKASARAGAADSEVWIVWATQRLRLGLSEFESLGPPAHPEDRRSATMRDADADCARAGRCCTTTWATVLARSDYRVVEDRRRRPALPPLRTVFLLR